MSLSAAKEASSPLVFFASLIVDLRMLRPLFGPGGDLLGLRVRAVVAKNRLAAPGGLADFDILRGQGLDRAAETLELALAHGLVEHWPQGFVWEGVFLGRGRAAARAELESDPALRVALAARLGEPRGAG